MLLKSYLTRNLLKTGLFKLTDSFHIYLFWLIANTFCWFLVIFFWFFVKLNYHLWIIFLFYWISVDPSSNFITFLVLSFFFLSLSPNVLFFSLSPTVSFLLGLLQFSRYRLTSQITTTIITKKEKKKNITTKKKVCVFKCLLSLSLCLTYIRVYVTFWSWKFFWQKLF